LQPPNLIALDGQRHRNTLDNHVTVADMASAAAYPPALAASLRAASKARIVNFAATAHGVRSDSCRSWRYPVKLEADDRPAARPFGWRRERLQFERHHH